MKTNISGVANNLAIGRGATINSDTSSLVRIQDDPLNYTYAKVEADTTITNTIENPVFFARSNAIYTDAPLYIGDAIYFQGNEQVIAKYVMDLALGTFNPQDYPWQHLFIHMNESYT